MAAKADEKWGAYPTTPGMGTSGWAFIRQKERAYDFHGYVFGMNSYDGPNGSATLLAKHLNKMETTINALQQQLVDALRHDTAMDLQAQENWARVLELERQLADAEVALMRLYAWGYSRETRNYIRARPNLVEQLAAMRKPGAALNPPSAITPGEAQG